MDNIPILTKRRLQAEVVGPLYQEMVERVGQHKAEQILESAIQKAAIDEGRQFAAQSASSDQSPMRRFIDLFEQWTTGGALEVDTLLESDAVSYTHLTLPTIYSV